MTFHIAYAIIKMLGLGARRCFFRDPGLFLLGISIMYAESREIHPGFLFLFNFSYTVCYQRNMDEKTEVIELTMLPMPPKSLPRILLLPPPLLPPPVRGIVSVLVLV